MLYRYMLYRFNYIYFKFCYKYIQLRLCNGRNALTYLYTLYAKYVLRCGTPLLADSSLISSLWARDLFVHWEASEIRPRGLWRRLLDCGSPLLPRKRRRQESYLITMRKGGSAKQGRPYMTLMFHVIFSELN